MEDLLAKYFAGEASASEIKEVEDWRGASKSHAKAYLEAKKIWLAGSAIDQPKKEDLRKIIGAETPIISILPKIFRYAAVLILISGLSYLGYIYVGGSLYSGDVIVAEKLLNTKLPDGSLVTLQKGSTLTVVDFDNSRAVKLSGRAYFDIKPDKNKPFTIETESARVQVVGTTFVVNSLQSNETEVIVESGVVNLYQNPTVFNGSNMMISLNPGESGELTVGKRGIRKHKVKDQNYLAWKTGLLTFKNTYMTEVAEILENTYGVDVVFKNPAIRLCKLTANYKKKTSDEVVSYISETFDFTYTIEGNKVIFSGTGCQ
ncbi:MAG: FecR family protein [Bacteroidota bacterium]